MGTRFDPAIFLDLTPDPAHLERAYIWPLRRVDLLEITEVHDLSPEYHTTFEIHRVLHGNKTL